MCGCELEEKQMETYNQPTQERILSAAAKLFAIKGYNGTTTREIVAEAGSSLSSIQFHFKSKENLYQAALERTLSIFYDLNASLLSEIDETERHGLLSGASAWDMIVELTGQVTEWVFCEEYNYEILLINRELLYPSAIFKRMPNSVLGLYKYYEKLFEAYVGVKDTFWAKSLSFSIVASIFDFGIYPYIMGQVLECDTEDPKNIPRIKTHMKHYLLSSMQAYLIARKQEVSEVSKERKIDE